MPSASPDNDVAAKRQVLTGLSASLSALGERMRLQQAAAVRITTMAARAEQMAERALDLNRGKLGFSQGSIERLVVDITAFATATAEAATSAGQEALLSGEVANVMHQMSGEMGKLASDLNSIPDVSSLRGRLRPLATVLETLPARLKATESLGEGMNFLAGRAKQLAARCETLTSPGQNAHRNAEELARDLRRFSEEAASVSLTMARDAAMAVTAVDTLARRAAAMASPDLSPTAAASKPEDRLGDMLRKGATVINRDPGMVRPQGALPPGAMVWGAVPPGRAGPTRA